MSGKYLVYCASPNAWRGPVRVESMAKALTLIVECDPTELMCVSERSETGSTQVWVGTCRDAARTMGVRCQCGACDGDGKKCQPPSASVTVARMAVEAEAQHGVAYALPLLGAAAELRSKGQ